jgi:hypothetical protein
MMTTRTNLTLLAGAILLAGSAGSARADYSFNFDAFGLTTSSSDQSTQLPGTYGNIAVYMDKVIGGTCAVNLNCVTVQGLDSLGNTGLGAGYGVAVGQKYTGDGHVVGPGGVSLTLGNSTNTANNSASVSGTYDNYLSNVATLADGTSPSQLSQGILITFSHGISLTGTFSFDYEVFPDGSCPSVGSCSSTPDLIVTTNGSTAYSHTFLGVAPGTLTNGTSTHSPLSGAGTELAPQLIGTSGNITLTNATTLKFMDWPAAIGIDNLKLVTATPEPMGQVFLLAGLGLVALAGKRLRRTLAKSSPEA